MITFADLDMMARGGSIALLLLWSWLLIRDHGRTLPPRMGLAMNVGIILHVIATIPGPVQHNGPVDYIVELGSASVPGCFWLFARTWFNDETRIGWRRLAMVGAVMIIVAVQINIFEARGTPSLPVALVMRAAMFAFAAAGLWEAWRGREGDLVEGRRRIRLLLIGSVGLYVILTNGVEIVTYLGFLPQMSRSFIEFGIVLLAGALCAALFTLRQSDLFAPLPKARDDAGPAAPDPALAALASRLTAHIEHDRSWRDEALTISGLAAQLGEPEYRLRRVINGQLGHRNFAAFLNGYRLGEVKAALADPTQNDVSILTIALDAGFGSLGPFNRAFREAEGMTPSEFRARA